MRTGVFGIGVLSLRGKVMLVVIAGMFLAVGSLAVLVYEFDQRLLERQLIQVHRQGLNTFTLFVGRSIRERNLQVLHEALEIKARENDVRYVLVCDGLGKVVARSGSWEKRFPSVGREDRPARERDSKTVERSYAARAAGSDGGHKRFLFEVDASIPNADSQGDWTVYLGVDARQSGEEAIANTRRVVVLSSIALAVAILAVSIVDRHLRKIVRGFTDVTRRMAAGDRTLRVDIRTGDELQVLGDSFNRMADALTDTEEQVRNHAAGLEARVTDRTRALSAEKQKLGAILNAVRAGLILYGSGPRVIWLNDVAQGWLRGSSSLSPGVQRELFRGSDGVEALARRVLDGREGFEHEKQVSDTHGLVHHFRIAATPIVAVDGGEEIQALVLLLDISKERTLERRIQQTSKLAAIGELAGGVAHEVNTPVAVVIAKAEFLLERLRGNAASRDIEDLEKILKNGRRIATIAHDLLAFSRRPEVHRTDVSVNGVVAETTAQLKEWVESSGVNMSTTLAPELPLVYANAGELQRVLSNLITNAVAAMMDMNGKKRLELATERRGGHVLIQIADTGGGVPPELRERIFEPFFSTKGVGEGTGLGLSISREIVRAHGGQIIVESTVGKGTTFTVKLPTGAEAVNHVEGT